MRRRRARVAAALLAVATGVVALSGCSDAAADEARPVTTEESQLLAIARFSNFDTGTRAVSAALTDGEASA